MAAAAASSNPSRFVRAEGEEEITPPCPAAKTRSFDSLSVAQILQAKLDPLQPIAPSSPVSSDPCSSPTVTAAAAALTRVGAGAMDDRAVDCLMSLSALSAPPNEPRPAAAKKRQHEARGGGRAAASDLPPGTRRRLKMRPNPSPLTAHGARGRGNGVANAAPAAPPIKLISGASLTTLKLLAAAFKLCPSPTPSQLDAVAARLSMDVDQLTQWFESRRTLQEWVASQPHLQPSDLVSMFYSADGAAAPALPTHAAAPGYVRPPPPVHGPPSDVGPGSGPASWGASDSSQADAAAEPHPVANAAAAASAGNSSAAADAVASAAAAATA